MESGEQVPAPNRDAAYFDQWYADMATSPARDAIVARTLGLPPELQSTSMLTWPGIAEVTEALRLPPDGLMCVDAVQFAEPPLAALLEFRRLLTPRAQLVLSCWEAADPADERASPRIRAVNLRRDLPAAGFTEVQVHDKPEWREIEHRMWQEMLAVPADADAAMVSLQREGQRSLDTFDSLRRVFATATAP